LNRSADIAGAPARESLLAAADDALAQLVALLDHDGRAGAGRCGQCFSERAGGVGVGAGTVLEA
jgi:hypothetical protein